MAKIEKSLKLTFYLCRELAILALQTGYPEF